jgi:ribosomal protein S17E
MILTAKRLIERQASSLAKAFEVNGKKLEVLIDVHQQFAATFDTSTDKRNHLDIINKVAPLQKMLT